MADKINHGGGQSHQYYQEGSLEVFLNPFGGGSLLTIACQAREEKAWEQRRIPGIPHYRSTPELQLDIPSLLMELSRRPSHSCPVAPLFPFLDLRDFLALFHRGIFNTMAIYICLFLFIK